MVKFVDLFINFMFIGIIVISLLAFGIFIQDENNVSEPFIENTVMNSTYSTLKTDLGGLSDEGQAQKTLFESENPTGGFGTILLFSIVSAGKVFNGMLVGVFNAIIKLPVTVLGIDPIIISVISTMLIISIIVGLWVLYKLG